MHKKRAREDILARRRADDGRRGELGLIPSADESESYAARRDRQAAERLGIVRPYSPGILVVTNPFHARPQEGVIILRPGRGSPAAAKEE